MDTDKGIGGRSILAVVGACVLAIGIASYWHGDLGSSGTAIEVSAADLAAAYIRNAAEADQRFGDSELVVTGLAGVTQLEGSDHVLTLVPGIRAHLGSQTEGANLFQQVTVRCDGLSYANGIIDLEDCEIITDTQTDAVAEEVSEITCLGTNYGHAPDEKVAAAFEAATGQRQGFCVVEEERGPVVTRPLQLVDLPSGKALLTQQEIEDGCHGCLGGIGVYYLTEQRGRLRVTGRWPLAVEGSGFGKPPADWHITTEFTSAPAIYAESGDMGQGYAYRGATITELSPEGPMTSDPISVGYSDEGAVIGGLPCILDGEIGNIQKDRSFEVRFTGSRQFTDRYVKRGGKFIDLSRQESDEACG